MNLPFNPNFIFSVFLSALNSQAVDGMDESILSLAPALRTFKFHLSVLVEQLVDFPYHLLNVEFALLVKLFLDLF